MDIFLYYFCVFGFNYKWMFIRCFIILNEKKNEIKYFVLIFFKFVDKGFFWCVI